VSIYEKTPDIASFDKAIGGDGMVIAKFQTSTCVICRRLEPGLKQMTERLKETPRIIDVDLEEIAELGERYNVRAVPTLILFSNGGELARCSGFQSSSMLRDWIAPHITGGE
jgi:thioredoxin-like negative regulator of GroEL